MAYNGDKIDKILMYNFTSIWGAFKSFDGFLTDRNWPLSWFESSFELLQNGTHHTSPTELPRSKGTVPCPRASTKTTQTCTNGMNPGHVPKGLQKPTVFESFWIIHHEGQDFRKCKRYPKKCHQGSHEGIRSTVGHIHQIPRVQRRLLVHIKDACPLFVNS